MSEHTELHATAVSLLSRGRPAEAERLFRKLLASAPSAGETEYDEWMRGLAESNRALGRMRETGHALVYLQEFKAAHAAFLVEESHFDAARTRELHARSLTQKSPPSTQPDTSQIDQAYVTAARDYEQAGRPVHAAIAYALGQKNDLARRQWERVASDARLEGKPYEQALCWFNLGLIARKSKDMSRAHRELSRAQQLIEEVADDYEARGERERAFDCYALLLHLGREEGSFENLAEGYTNCIRVLKGDSLKFHALQYYEDFLRLALDREEFHAAAQVAREAADYARRLGLSYDRGYLKRSAEAWWRAAEKNERDAGSVELTENAYLAAVNAFSALGDFFHVRESYERLVKVALGDKKQERYKKVCERYAGVAEEQVQAVDFPDSLRQQHAYPAIWELDLVEWELDGDPLAVCASIVGDRRYASTIRRRAMQVLLLQLDGLRTGGPQIDEPQRAAAIAQGLGDVQAYTSLRPLEKLFEHPHFSVRRGVMRALRNLFFPRTFVLLASGLRDEANEVVDAAIESLDSLHFPHAFNPLSRIFREHTGGPTEQRVKMAVLQSMGRIATLEAGEFLIDVVRYERDPFRETARRLLTTFDNPDIFPIVRRHLEMENGRAQKDLLQVMRGAGGR